MVAGAANQFRKKFLTNKLTELEPEKDSSSKFTEFANKRNVELEISKSVSEWIAENGYDKDMGARPMERFIASNIKKPLVDKLLFGDLKAGGLIKIDMVFHQIFGKRKMLWKSLREYLLGT